MGTYIQIFTAQATAATATATAAVCYKKINI
jgi:hypothetical protein